MILPSKRCAIMNVTTVSNTSTAVESLVNDSTPAGKVDDHVDSSEDSEAPFSSVVYHVGDRVDGFYQGFRGPQLFFPGHITAVHLDGTYDIEYDDGDKETHVAAGFIRFYEDDHEEVDNGRTNEDHLTSSVSGTSFDEFKLARIVRSQMISMVFVWVFLSLSVSASEYIHDTIHRPLQSRTSNSPNEHDSSGGNQTGRVSSVYDTELIRFSNALRIAFQR